MIYVKTYDIPIEEKSTIKLPYNAKPLSIELFASHIYCRFLVNSEDEKRMETENKYNLGVFIILGYGEQSDDFLDDCQYLGSVLAVSPNPQTRLGRYATAEKDLRPIPCNFMQATYSHFWHVFLRICHLAKDQ